MIKAMDVFSERPGGFILAVLVVGILALEFVAIAMDRLNQEVHEDFHGRWEEEQEDIRRMREEEDKFYKDWIAHQKDMIAREERREIFFERWGKALENAECEATVIEAIKEDSK